MSTEDYRGTPSESQETRPLLSDNDHHQTEVDPESSTAAAANRREPRFSFSSTIKRLKHPDQLSNLEKLLLFLSLVILLISFLFLGLFLGALSRLNHGGRQPGHGRDDKDGKDGNNDLDAICSSPDCVFASAEILRGIDSSIDPCDDFYHFAAGGWLQSHSIPSDQGLFGIGQWLAIENAKTLRKLLSEAPISKKDGELQISSSDKRSKVDLENLSKLRAFYDSCLDLDLQDKAGAQPLLDVVDQLISRLHDDIDLDQDVESEAEEEEEHLLSSVYLEKNDIPVPPNRPPGRNPIPHPPTQDPIPLPPMAGRQKGFTEALAWAHSRDIPLFFEWMVDGDAKNDPTYGTASLFPSGLGYPDKAYYEDEDELEFYHSVVYQGLQTLEDEQEASRESKDLDSSKKHKKSKDSKKKKKKKSKKEIKRLAEEVVELETSIASITPSGPALADPIKTYNPVTVAQLSYDFPSLEWTSYLSALTVKPPKSIILTSPKFVKSLDSLISRTKTDVLEAYFSWTIVRTLGMNLGPNVSLKAPAERLDRRSKGVDPDVQEDRASTCLASLNEALGFMAGRYFVEKDFPPESKRQGEVIIQSIIQAFKERLPNLDWLDDETRKAAEKKADAVRIKVGYPDASPNTTDAASVAKFYADLKVERKDYFGNQLNSATRQRRNDWASVGRTLDPKRWEMFTSEVNAQYSPLKNEILFPAGIMQIPYFSYKWPSFLQYGAFGAVSGHELSHAFDPDGRQFDQDGYLKDWWTNDTAVEFNKRRDCLIAQYKNYTISDGKGGRVHLNPELTIGEDVADAGGLAQAFLAWKNSWKKQREEGQFNTNAKLPGLDYTQEQLFFIAYGLSWSRNIRDQEAIRRLRTDPHSPTAYRVTGVLANNVDFIEAFGCKKGVDRMAKSDEERCEIW